MPKTSLKSKWAVVSFESAQEAKDALDNAKSKFNRNVPHSQDLSYTSGNMVYLHVAVSGYSKLETVKKFLLEQPGALPAGCLVKD